MSSDRRRPGPERDLDLDTLQAAWPRLASAEPPAMLDQRVLNAARRAVAPKPRRWRWIGAFATAGVVVLAVSVALLQEWQPAAPAPVVEGLELRREYAPSAADAPMQSAAEAENLAVGAAREDAVEADAAPKAATESGLTDAIAPRRAMDRAAPALQAEQEPGRSPTEWIERLLQLRAGAGKEDEAFRRELEAFRAAYPDYPLPPELEPGG